MNNPILSWGDTEETPIMAKARQSVNALDTTDAVNEMDEQARRLEEQRQLRGIGAINQPTTDALLTQPNDVNGSLSGSHTASPTIKPVGINLVVAGSALERAAAAVAIYNTQMEFGERVKAVDKRLINSKTDLNQLIPFKYTWAWSMYLQSTENHWMPGEADGYLLDEKQWSTFKTSEKKLVYRLVVNYMYSQYLYRPEMLVNLYRLSTNPEVRQYELRQSFEEQAFHHSIRHIIETFDLHTDDIKTLALDESIFRDRNIALKPFIAKMGDMETSTALPEEIGDFVVSLTVLYGVMRTLYHLVPLFQIWKLHKTTGKMAGVAQNIEWILRDMNRQWDFGKRYITGILDENPGVLQTRHVEQIQQIMKIAQTANEDFLSTLTVDDTDYQEATYCSKWFANNFLQSLGIPTQPLKINPDYDGFIDYFLGLGDKDHGTAKVALGTSSNEGGSLDWE